MLESRPEDALVLLVKLQSVETAEIVETVETVETEDTVEIASSPLCQLVLREIIFVESVLCRTPITF